MDTKEVAEKAGQTKDTTMEALKGSSGEPAILLGPPPFARPSLKGSSERVNEGELLPIDFCGVLLFTNLPIIVFHFRCRYA